MPGFGSGIAHALTAGLVGYDQGEDEQRKQMIILAAQKRQEQRQAEQDNIARIGALASASNAGLDVSPLASPPRGPASAPAVVPDTASMRAQKGQNPTTPTGGQPAPATPSTDGNVLGTIGGMQIRMPQGPLIDKATRDAQAKDAQRVAARLARVKAVNDKLPDGHPDKLSDEGIAAVAGDDASTNDYIKGTLGIGAERNPVVGSKEWEQAEIKRAKIAAQYGYHPPPSNVYVTGLDANGKPTIFQGKSKGDTPLQDTGVGKPVAGGRGGANGPLNQDETYAAQHLPIVARSIGVIQQATAPGIWQTLAHRSLLGNYTLTPQGQQYNAAVDRAALSLAVTLEGPRGATPQRVAIVKQTYFPKPGDDDTTKDDKVAQLKNALRNGKVKAGRAWEKMAPQDRSVIDQFSGDTPAGTPDQTVVGATPAPAANPFASLIPAKRP